MPSLRYAALVLVLVFGLAAMAVAAQDGNGSDDSAESPPQTQDGTPTAGNPALLSVQDAANFLAGLRAGTPFNATPVAVALLQEFESYPFDLQQDFNVRSQPGQATTPTSTDTQDPTAGGPFAQLAACGPIRVYKVGANGSMDLWPNASCGNDVMTVQAGGTGHYVFFRFSNSQTALNAPTVLTGCPAADSASGQPANQQCGVAFGGGTTTAATTSTLNTQGQTVLPTQPAPPAETAEPGDASPDAEATDTAQG